MQQITNTIVVLIALPEEFEFFKGTIPHIRDHSTQRRIRLEHDTGVQGYRLISVLAEQMGSQSASQSAEAAINDFSPDLVIVLGIAGGVSSDLIIGDVCVANDIIDVLQNNKVEEKDGKTEIHFAPEFYSVDAELVASFTFLRNHPSLEAEYVEWQERSSDTALRIGLPNAIRNMQVHIGPVACGPVSASKAFNDKLKSLHRKVIAIETESGGIFSKVSARGIPAIAIRGISDFADDQKAELEKRSKGGARKLAMLNAVSLLQAQL